MAGIAHTKSWFTLPEKSKGNKRIKKDQQVILREGDSFAQVCKFVFHRGSQCMTLKYLDCQNQRLTVGIVFTISLQGTGQQALPTWH